MKNALIYLMLIMPLYQVYAQTAEVEELPKKYIGLNLNGIYSAPDISSTDEKQILLNTAPFFGYSVKNFVFGAGLNYSYQHNKYKAIYTNTGSIAFATSNYNEISFFPIVRYYTKLGLFGTSSFNYGIGKGKSDYPSSISRTTAYTTLNSESKFWSANIGIGYAIKAGKSFLIEPQIVYQYTDKTTTNKSSNSYLYSLYNPSTNTTTTNILLGFGLTYCF